MVKSTTSSTKCRGSATASATQRTIRYYPHFPERPFISILILCYDDDVSFKNERSISHDFVWKQQSLQDDVRVTCQQVCQSTAAVISDTESYWQLDDNSTVWLCDRLRPPKIRRRINSLSSDIGNLTKDTQFVTGNTWHLTHEPCHVTSDTKQVTHDTRLGDNGGFCCYLFWHVIGDTWHMAPDSWHPTRATWHMTHNTWHLTPDMRHLTPIKWHLTPDYGAGQWLWLFLYD